MPQAPATMVQEADVTGVDLSEVMISAAKQKFPKARWLTGNALALPSLLVSPFFCFFFFFCPPPSSQMEVVSFGLYSIRSV